MGCRVGRGGVGPVRLVGRGWGEGGEGRWRLDLDGEGRYGGSGGGDGGGRRCWSDGEES